MKGDKPVEELVSLCVALEQGRKPFESVWDEITDLFYTKRYNYAPKNPNASKRPPHRYSSKAKRAYNIASKGFQGYTADRRSDWMVLQFEDQTLMGMYGVQDWLEQGHRALSAHFSRAGFYEGLAELIPDAMNLGIGTIYSEEISSLSRIAYRCKHPKATYYAENAFGEIDIARDEEWVSYRSAVERFGLKNLHESWQRNFETRPLDNVLIQHITMPMDERYLEYAKSPTVRTWPFISIWLDLENQHIIDVGGFWEFPYFVWRYEKSAGDAYGFGPGFDVIDDTLIANQMTRSRIALANLIADPPLTVPEALEGRDQIIPGHHIYTTKDEQEIRPVPFGANYPITVDNEDKIEGAIDAHYNVAIYQMLEQMEARNKTATEVIEMAGERVAVLGPIVGGYENQVLQPAVRRSFNMLMRSGQLPPPPKAVIDAFKDGQYLKVEFMGRLSQISRRYYKSDGTTQALGIAGALAQLYPDALDNIDFDQLTREGLENAGAPASVIREKEDVQAIRANRAQQQQALMQKQEQDAAQQTIIQNIDKLGKRPEAGSPASNEGIL